MSLTIRSSLPLKHTGPPHLTHPVIGLGVYLSPQSLCKQTCLAALRTGYTLIDTAQYYENEAAVGEAVRESGIDRSTLYITTKILTPAGSVEKTLEKCRQSVKDIGLGYVDLFLIHSPRGGPESRREMWAALQKLREEGLTKAIGVSNYGPHHLEEMKTYSSIVPCVNQVEFHPWCQQRKIVDYCKANDILVEGYCPLRRGDGVDSPVITEIAKAKGATPAQVLLRWSVQTGVVPLPKSDNPERIKENADIFGFELGREEMEQLNQLDQGSEGAIVSEAGVDCP